MNNQNTTFEQDMTRLEQIVRKMEQGDITLEESLALFREGTELVQTCEKRLNDAELQIKKIVPDENGEPAEEDFICES